ncbi:hypothetical protein EPUL_002318 [Erysiphe pulchra]|uniref:Uncharacterized protein n=1 Tax=Erysiphe pulchra TaxID=225359 RepID=A0A2S4PVV2_9PEZI|nr:hypothetical protein EPUL_002318 [Erysiphe pulchra]
MSNRRQDRGVRVSQRDTLSYWLPLTLTVSVAALGIATWIWSERKDDEELPRGPSGNKSYPKPGQESRSDDKSESNSSNGSEAAIPLSSPLYNQGYMARMSDVLRRTPSPQQIFDGASKSIVVGFTAATAVVGTALGSIMEEDKNAYKDHQTWSEEVNSRKSEFILHNSSTETAGTIKPSTNSGKRKTVAIVISASGDSRLKGEKEEFQEYASILSYLPQKTNFLKIRLFILIYAPLLKVHPLDASSSYIELQGPDLDIHEGQAQLIAENSKKIHIPATSPTIFDIVYSEALRMVEKETMVLPFTSAAGHLQILRHLNPDVIYLQESLSGVNGEFISNLQTWLRQDMVLIIGDGCTSSGLADTDSEVEPSDSKNYWWKREERIGKGRGVIVIEAFRVGDDWEKRVENKE